jgi:hypothetical protein
LKILENCGYFFDRLVIGSAYQLLKERHMIDNATLLACFIATFGVVFLTWIARSQYKTDKYFRYLINFLWFAQTFIWVSVVMLWG